MTRRRQILLLSASACFAQAALAQTPKPAGQAQKVSESDPQAQSLGYVDDAKRADKKRFPKYAAGQRCAACQLYNAPPSAATGPCAIFSGKLVAGPGWCSAFVPRAA